MDDIHMNRYRNQVKAENLNNEQKSKFNEGNMMICFQHTEKKENIYNKKRKNMWLRAVATIL